MFVLLLICGVYWVQSFEQYPCYSADFSCTYKEISPTAGEGLCTSKEMNCDSILTVNPIVPLNDIMNPFIGTETCNGTLKGFEKFEIAFSGNCYNFWSGGEAGYCSAQGFGEKCYGQWMFAGKGEQPLSFIATKTFCCPPEE